QPRALAQVVMAEQHLGRDFRPDAGHVAERDGQQRLARRIGRMGHVANLLSRIACAARTNTSAEPKPPALVTTGRPAARPPVSVPMGTPPVTSPTRAMPVAPSD